MSESRVLRKRIRIDSPHPDPAIAAKDVSTQPLFSKEDEELYKEVPVYFCQRKKEGEKKLDRINESDEAGHEEIDVDVVLNVVDTNDNDGSGGGSAGREGDAGAGGEDEGEDDGRGQEEENGQEGEEDGGDRSKSVIRPKRSKVEAESRFYAFRDVLDWEDIRFSDDQTRERQFIAWKNWTYVREAYFEQLKANPEWEPAVLRYSTVEEDEARTGNKCNRCWLRQRTISMLQESLPQGTIFRPNSL